MVLVSIVSKCRLIFNIELKCVNMRNKHIVKLLSKSGVKSVKYVLY